DSRHAARQNLAALLDELRKNIRALVVDEVHLLDTELADFLFAEILALAARTPARTPRTTASRSAFTARTTVPAAWTMASTAFAARRSTVRLCLFLFLCHTILPFPLRTGKNQKNETRKTKFKKTKLAGRSLFRCGRSAARSGCSADGRGPPPRHASPRRCP